MNQHSIFKEKLIEEVDSVVLDEEIKITPEIENQNPIFPNNEKIFEEVTFNKSNSSHNLYRLFMEAKIDSKTGKPGENSRIDFFSIKGFPDGCFYIVDSEKSEINCYICELKHKPGDKALKIARQFYLGLIHCKAFFSSVKLDDVHQINYHFFIVGFLESCDRLEKQLITNGAVKASPGVKPASPLDLRAYQNYKKGKINFPYVKDYSEKFEFPFKFIQLEVQGVDSAKIVKLTKSCRL